MRRWKGTVLGAALELQVGETWKKVLVPPESELTIVALERIEEWRWPMVHFKVAGESLGKNGLHRTGAPAFIVGVRVTPGRRAP